MNDHGCNLETVIANHHTAYLVTCGTCGWTVGPLLSLDSAEAEQRNHETDCDHCGEPSTHRAAYTDQPTCDDCEHHDDEDGPMGGMGYGISYDHALAEARKLK